jgi:hypothetical protein
MIAHQLPSMLRTLVPSAFILHLSVLVFPNVICRLRPASTIPAAYAGRLLEPIARRTTAGERTVAPR